MMVLHQPEALPAAVYIHFFFFPLFSLGVLGSQFCFQISNVRVSGSQKYTILLLLDHAGSSICAHSMCRSVHLMKWYIQTVIVE